MVGGRGGWEGGREEKHGLSCSFHREPLNRDAPSSIGEQRRVDPLRRSEKFRENRKDERIKTKE